MNLALSDDQRMIRDAAENFLAGVSGSAQVRKAMTGATGFDDGVWTRIGSELGWCGIAIAEKFGGLAKEAIERTVKELQELRRQAASQIVIPQGGLPPAGGMGPGGKIQMP